MAAKTTGNGLYANSLLKLIFNAVAFAQWADNAASSPNTVVWVSLHTADPGVNGSQNTSEAAYGGYTRISVARTAGGWTVTNNSVSPVAPIVFPVAASGSETETYWGVGRNSSGTGELLYRGPIAPNIVVVTGVQPELTTATAVTET